RTGRARVSDVIAAQGVQSRLPIVMRGANPDGEARQPRDWLDHADELRGPERAAELIEARGEIGDSDHCALTIAHLGRANRGVADILRLDVDTSLEGDVRESLLFPARKQPAEDRIAVEARKTPPHDSRRGIDERSRAPVADHSEIQSVVDHESP